jgi:hypothetical protein
MPPSQLLQQLRDVIRRKHYSIRTEETYVQWVKHYIRYHQLRHPAAMDEGDVVQFLTHLAVVRQYPPPPRTRR